ncbi:MFS transporter [Roseicyclus sp.]|uniref:MFS transporter n=1 Tax=Roseicyclus sp. TaxID=1914329 RepID=UPI003F6B4850
MTRPTGPFLFILATMVIDAIGIGIVFPIMPDLMDRVGATGAGQGAFWGGVLLASYAAAQFIFAPIVGAISDAYGRKPVLLAALAFLALDYVIMALADSFWLLLIGRTLAGLAGATYITATAYVSDITPPDGRAARFGLIGAAFGLGFVLGPALGGVAAAWHITAPFWLAAGLAGINVIFGLFVLPESLAPAHRRPFALRDLNPFGTIWRAFRLPGLAIPLICLGLFEFANMVYVTLWSFWGRELFGWSTLVIGLSLSAYGILAALSQIFVMPRAINWLGERRLMLLGLMLAVVAFAGFSVTTALWAVVILLPLSALTDLVPPTLTAMAANSVEEDQQGMVQGVIAALASLAAVLAPLVFTPAFGAFVGDGVWVYWPGAPFALAALIVAMILPIAWRQGRVR